MSEGVDSVLEAGREGLEHALLLAQEELVLLEGRRLDLHATIGALKQLLGQPGPPMMGDRDQAGGPGSTESYPPAPTYGDHVAWRQRTLHKAIDLVLRERGNEWITAPELAEEINRRRLYWMKDGSPVGINQIHARVGNYSTWFEKDGPRIRLAADRDKTAGR